MINPIDYWYKKYIALKECERIPKPELAWQDIKTIIAIEGNIYIEAGNDQHKVVENYDTEEKFYGEILRRFNKTKEDEK